MKTMVIICIVIAIIAIILALLAFVVNKMTIDYINEKEEEMTKRMDNFSEALHLHAIDKDLHKIQTKKRYE